MAVWASLVQFHFDTTITLGNLLTFAGLIAAALRFWIMQTRIQADMNWRVTNLETWRKEHMIDADARDDLIQKVATIEVQIAYLVKEQERDNYGRRQPPPKTR